MAEVARKTAGQVIEMPPRPSVSKEPEDVSAVIKRFRLLKERALIGAEILELVEAKPVYVWRGIAQEEHHIEIAGPSASGKTTLLFLLVVATANPTGKPVKVLGHDVVPNPAGKISVLVEEENQAASCRRKLIASCEMLGLPVAETLDRVLLLARQQVKAHRLQTGIANSVWRDIALLGDQGHVGALFLDSRARIFDGGDSNLEEDQAGVAECIAQMINATSAPLVLVSHTRKSGSDAIEDLAGHHQRGAGADVILLVNAERDAGRVIASKVTFVKLREDEDEWPMPVTFSIGRDDGGKWNIETGASARGSDQPAHERVVALLSAEGPMTKAALRQRLGINETAFEFAITALFAEKRVRRQSSLVGGRTRSVFALTREGGPFVTANEARKERRP